ncbi:MAG: hypothetical protein GTO18_15900 [Anaerolineales bacterium]|nr:hypothetical protein [Anaerolineales bacterium]
MYQLEPQRKGRSRLNISILILGILGLIAITAGLVYQIPFVQENLAWRISEVRSKIKYALSPPGEVVFTPNPTLASMVQSTLDAMTPTLTPTSTLTPTPTSTPELTHTPTPSPTPLPESVFLDNIRHEYQSWNNCGPANLSMALSYWDWQGNQTHTASYLKPNPRDKNVMPYEIENFVNDETDLNILVRVGGDLDMIKSFIAAGFPVLIEKGFETPRAEGWMGHYQVLAGYDDERQIFNAYDSFEGDFTDGKTLAMPYEKIETYWRHFNNTYIIIYPGERETEVYKILGPHLDETYNFTHAAGKASIDILQQTGREQFFAWFNRGTNLMRLQDYGGAANAYDEAFNIYATLDPDTRPWRILWYQTGPYFAYYFTGRYHDVINLANQILENASEPVMEESYYWRALARESLGDLAGAIRDLEKSLKYHPGFQPSEYQLDRLGVSY